LTKTFLDSDETHNQSHVDCFRHLYNIINLYITFVTIIKLIHSVRAKIKSYPIVKMLPAQKKLSNKIRRTIRPSKCPSYC